MISLFPSKTFNVRLSSNDPSAWTRLRESTELRDSLVSVRTSKTFIGQVRASYFKLISSRIGHGAFCTLEGKFTTSGGSGTIHIEVHKAFRILIGCWTLAVGGLIAFTVWQRGFSTGWIVAVQIVEVIVFIIIIRFVVIGGLFRSLVKSGMEALTTILGLVDVTEVE